MTNEQLQLIGISEAAFNAATEEQRIEWNRYQRNIGRAKKVAAGEK